MTHCTTEAACDESTDPLARTAGGCDEADAPEEIGGHQCGQVLDPDDGAESQRVLVAISRLHAMDGVASNLATLVPALRSQGWGVHFAVGRIDCQPGQEQTVEAIRDAASSFRVESLLAGVKSPNAGWILATSLRLKKIARETGAGVIHLRGRGLGPPSMLCRLLGGPPVVNVPPLAPDASSDSGVARLIRMQQGRLLGHRVIAISQDMQRQLANKWGVPRHVIRYVPHGVKLSHFYPASPAERREARRQLNIPDDAFVATQLARVCPIKRPETLVLALANLKEQGRKVVGLFSGHCDDLERKRLEQLASDRGVRNQIHFRGHCNAKLVLMASDAKVLASEREGFGIAIVEAMASGVVPIRTPVEGALDQIDDGVDGMLFPVGDADALAGCLSRLIDSPRERARMSEAALRKAQERFTDAAMARGVISVYQELLPSRCGKDQK